MKMYLLNHRENQAFPCINANKHQSILLRKHEYKIQKLPICTFVWNTIGFSVQMALYFNRTPERLAGPITVLC